MLARLSDPRLAIFCGMFIVLQIYGTKRVWNNSCFSALRASVFADLDKSVNRKYFVRKKTYFDVGSGSISRVGASVGGRHVVCRTGSLRWTQMSSESYFDYKYFMRKGNHQSRLLFTLHQILDKNLYSHARQSCVSKDWPYTFRSLSCSLEGEGIWRYTGDRKRGIGI